MCVPTTYPLLTSAIPYNSIPRFIRPLFETKIDLQSKAREANAASERVAREAAQHKADSVMKHVLNVQDRLVQALQAELTMTNRAREAAQVRDSLPAIASGSQTRVGQRLHMQQHGNIFSYFV